jgi:phage shock protein C
MSNKGLFSRMRRYPKEGWIGGVCAGLAVHFGWNAKLLRILFAAGLLFSGFFPVGLVYCLLWYLMDDGTERHVAVDADPTRDANAPAPTMGDVKARFTRLEERLRSIEDSVISNEFELRRELSKLEGR